MALLLATIAGFGGIIGIFVRFIRGYNRISPYIAFFALLAVGLALEKQLTRRTGRSRKALAAVAILLLGGKAIRVLRDYQKQRRAGKNPVYRYDEVGVGSPEIWNEAHAKKWED